MSAVSTIRQRSRKDEGVAIPLVALAMVVILGVAALVIDIGNGIQTRRGLVTATDASALAAAQDYARNVNGCSSTASTYLLLNQPTATLDSCNQAAYNADHSRVTVEASQNVQTWFAGVIGRGDYQVSAVTSAVIAPPVTIYDLRPVGLCLEGSSDLENLYYNPPSTPTYVRVWYPKDSANDCGSVAPGNWGIVDFDGGPYNELETRLRFRYGESDEINFFNHVHWCPGTLLHCYPGDLGGMDPVLWTSLQSLVNRGIYFPVPLIRRTNSSGTQVHISAIMRVRMADYNISDPDPNNRFLGFWVMPGLLNGTCCGSGSGAGGSHIVAICGVDVGEFDACEP